MSRLTDTVARLAAKSAEHGRKAESHVGPRDSVWSSAAYASAVETRIATLVALADESDRPALVDILTDPVSGR